MAITGLASAAVDVPFTSSIRFRWKASDVISSPVTLWTDEIQGNNYYHFGANKDPILTTNSGLRAVSFYGTNYLTSTNIVILANDSWLWVFKWRDCSSGIWSSFENSGGQVQLGINNPCCWYNGTLGNVCNASTAFQDLFACCTNAPNGFMAFTNNINIYSQPQQWGGIGGNALTLVGASWNTSFTTVQVPCNVDMYEIINWTNKVFTSSDITKVHNYCVSTYGVSP